ncbi:MAG: hypothetical protein UT61_C0068G0004 [Candidatus Woesebacteria bacterium GW2011_GWA1_39_8]|jgi:predicted Zn-dependent protease with MMP-like domain|uniref:Metallopeptidase family protein n=1 Tax=Candidatus Woesebacteria bacterium GW2011_GWA1_39_8 TaxID=1618552 RepID=A0A0G0PRL0_9BACT|nr:MAG: hypothetical protein UT61_C0068G0004 [Candidatus Woesebacteria bacterium GW2011_GWA1_39_8]
MEEELFENIVSQALAKLPSEFKNKLENVSVIVSDNPTQEQYRKIFARGGGLLLGLYEGIPQTKRRHYGIGPTMPDKITIFKHPIIYVTGGDSKLISRQIIATVEHEIAHHFGMSDEEIRTLKHRKN